MAFANFKKKVAISNRYLSEKFSKNKETSIGTDYKEISHLIDTYKNYLQDVNKRALHCFEPGTNIRLRPPKGSTGNQPSKVSYPHAEALLAETCAKYSANFGQDSSLGSALDTVSDGYGKLSEAKTRAVEDVQSRFCGPIRETLDQELAEIMQLRKKTESRRLAYEVCRDKAAKGKMSTTDQDYRDTELKYNETYTISQSAMTNFLECEPEHVELLCNLVDAHLSFFRDAQAVLSDLQTRMQLKLKEAQAPDAPNPVQVFAAHKTPGGTPTCRALYDFVAENAGELTFKEGDIIQLIAKVDENWYQGELHGVEGYLPTTYVEVLIPLPK